MICISACILTDSSLYSIDESRPVEVRMIRSYGETEDAAPILLINSSKYKPRYGENEVNIEIDVKANVPPNLYVLFVHCKPDWSETENIFYQDIANLRYSNINWSSATYMDSWYSHRGRITVPNMSIKFKYSGNWKAKFYEYGRDSVLLGEARFFVVEPRADCFLNMYTDIYNSKFNVTRTSYTLEAVVNSSELLLDNSFSSAVFYRKHRWYEPYYCSERNDLNLSNEHLRYPPETSISGFYKVRKLFRAVGVPAENEYRVLYMMNYAQFPSSGGAVRLPFSDFIRNGSFSEYDNEGAMNTRSVSSAIDDYVLIEFLLDPDGHISKHDVFVVGSFNNWKPDKNWQMYWDEDERFYKLRQWVRRGVHDYLYASGKLIYDENRVVEFSTDEFEGNSSSSAHQFVCFIYYKDMTYGGYDALIAVDINDIYSYYR